MANPPDFDWNPAHEFFSKSCFNQAWDLIEKPNRTPEEDEQMRLLAHSSIWHWSQRADAVDQNFSIGYWQLSRIYALLNDADNSRSAAQMCLQKTPKNDAFLMGYALEALTRAEVIAGNKEPAQTHYSEAIRQADLITSSEDQQALLKDLEELSRRF